MKNIQGRKEELISSTEREQYRTHVVESHQGVGGEVSDLVGGLSLRERRVHLDPVAGDVKCYQHLEEEEVGRVEVAQD